MSESRSLEHFDHLYRQSRDPWKVHESWYEKRKRAVLLACLPHPRYRNAFEPACGTGALTIPLAQRCDALMAADGSPAAVKIARQHTVAMPQVAIDHLIMPRDWPEGPFDLVVLSEWLYYLSDDDLAETLRRCKASLSTQGTMIACHWRHGFDDRVQTTEQVHAALHKALGGPSLLRHDEPDFLIEVWGGKSCSVASVEGIA